MMPSRKTAIGLLGVAVAALALRVAAVVVLRSYEQPFTYEHGEIAENLLAGRGFAVRFLGVDGPTSQQSPLYPPLLAVAYAAWGVQSPQAFLAVQLVQSLAGALVAPCVALLCWSLLPERRALGWTAAWLAAVFPTHVYMATHIQAAVWIVLALVVHLALAAAPGVGGRLRGAVWVGWSGGILMLLEPIYALAMPVSAWLMWRGAAAGQKPPPPRRPRGAAARRVAPAVLAALAAAAVLTPWLVRNYRVHGEVVFVKSTFGYAFWQGNNPYSWGTDKIPKPSAEQLRQLHDHTPVEVERALREARSETLYIDDVLLKPTGYRDFAGLTEPQRSRLLGRRAWEFVRASPAHYLRLCAARLRYFWLFDETNPRAANAVYRGATLVWLLLSGGGLIALRRQGRQLAPLLALFAAVMVFHALTIYSARFRFPLEAVSLVWAAGSLEALRHRRRRGDAAPRGADLPAPHRPMTARRPVAAPQHR